MVRPTGERIPPSSRRSSRRQLDDDDDDRYGSVWARSVQRQMRNSGVLIGTPDSSGNREEASTRLSFALPEPTSARGTSSRALPQGPIFEGLLAAVVSPFDSNGAVDTSVVPSYAQSLKEDGVSGVFCCGTTGESMSLSVKERMETVDAWVRTGLKVCAHIGAFPLPETIQLAQHAERVGAHAIAVMAPSYFKPQSPSDAVAFFAEVSRAAPGIPLLIYHFPMQTGTPFTLHQLLNEARDRVPTLRGAKFTSHDLADFSACLGVKGITDLLYSWEPNMCGAAALGAKAFVGMQFSTVGPLYKRLIASSAKGDVEQVKKLQSLASQYMRMVQSAVGSSMEKAICATKALVSMRLNREVMTTRPPCPKLGVGEVQKLKDGMESFVAAYTAAVASTAAPAAAAAAPRIDVKSMPGYKGLLNDKIRSRVRDIEGKLRKRGLLSLFPHLDDPNWRTGIPSGNNFDCSQYIDHTILKPEVTRAEVTKLCDEAKKHNFYAVCVNGSRAEQCVEALRGTPVSVAAVIGFPLGAGTKQAKAREARELVNIGCGEIDMVMNVGAMKDGDYRAVYEDIKAVVEASAPGIVKVIFETCLLSADEIMDASILSVAAGAQFVKTSTGFNKGGATPEAIDIMLATVGNEAQTKASGGVRDLDAATAYITAGVKRIGTSSGIAIVSGKASQGGY